MSIRYTAEQLQLKFPGSAASSGFARVADAMRESVGASERRVLEATEAAAVAH